MSKGTLISVDEFLGGLTLDFDDQDGSLYVKMLNWLKYELCDLAAGKKLTQAKTVMLPILADRTVDLPDDYVGLGKIGVCCNGRIVTLGTCNELCPPAFIEEQKKCGCETNEEAIEQVIDCIGAGQTIVSSTTNEYLPPADFRNCDPEVEVEEGGVVVKKAQCNKCGTLGSHCCTCYGGVSWGDRSLGEKYGVGTGYNYLSLYKLDEANCRIILDQSCSRLPIGSMVVLEYYSLDGAENLDFFPKYMAKGLRFNLESQYYDKVQNNNLKRREKHDLYLVEKTFKWPRRRYTYTVKDIINLRHKHTVYGVR